MVVRILSIVVLCGLWLVPTTVSAAPFCVEAQGFPSECWYYDAQSCRDEAVKRDGRCSANVADISLPEAGSPFCIVGPGLVAACLYQTAESCDAEAAKRNAVCVERTESENTGDPYRFDRQDLKY